jgi:hypothetical protein
MQLPVPEQSPSALLQYVPAGQSVLDEHAHDPELAIETSAHDAKQLF